MTVIRDRLALIKVYLKILHELRKKVKDADYLTKDFIIRGAVERYLHLTIEALIDIGFRICSLIGLKKPERYRDIAHILASSQVLSFEKAKKLELWIGFRNILVHAYAKINVSEVFDALNSIDELENIIHELREGIELKGIDPEVLQGNNGVIPRILSVLHRKEYIVFAYLFGSRAKGTATKKSDIDIAIYAIRHLNWREVVELIHELEDVTKRRVDLVVLNNAPLLLAYEIILNNKVILDRDPEKRINYEVKILHKYLDLKPRLEKYFKELLSS